MNGAAAGFDLHGDRLAIGADSGFHGHLGDVGLDVLFLLPARAVKALPKISLAIEQADSDQGNAEVGSTFDMVAGKNTQAAGIFRDGIVQAELGGEICHRTRP